MNNSVLASTTDTLFVIDKWAVREMSLSPEKVDAMWEILRQYRTIFTDFTKGDKDNFVRLLASPDMYWLEIHDEEAEELVGLVYFQDLMTSTDALGHLVILDRKASEKAKVIQAIAKYMFDNFAINRISAPIPAIYFGSRRLLLKAGFKLEGTKREALLIEGKWHDTQIFGLLRSEVTDAVPV